MKFSQTAFKTSELISKFEIPIRLESPREIVSEGPDYLKSEFALVSEKLLDQVFGGHSANPNRDDVKKRLDSIFEVNSYSKNGSKIEFERMKSDLLKRMIDSNYLAVIGDRGSGKTLLINKILNDETKNKLDLVERINWFRIDVTKIYELREDSRSQSSKVNFSNYFRIHTAYVFLEYSELLRNPNSALHGSSPLLCEIAGHLRNNSKRRRFSGYRRALGIIKRFYKKISTEEGPIEEYPSEATISRLFYAEYAPIMDAYVKIYECFQRASNDLNMGVIAIIDGVDNVSWRSYD